MIKTQTALLFDQRGCRVTLVADINNNNSAPQSKTEGETRVVVENMISESYGHPRSISSIRPDDFAKFQGHLALLHHETVTPATVSSTVITTNLFQHFRTEVNGSPLGRKLERFSYMRGKFRVRVAVQGSSVLAGKIVLAFTPWVTNRGGYAPNVDYGFSPTVVNSMVVPHIIIDPSKTESQEMVLDCPTPTGVWTMQSPDDYGSYRVDMFVVSPLFSGTATIPDVSVCIYGGLEEASLEGITLLSSEPFIEEDKTARPSDIMTSLGDLSGVVGKVFPALSPYTNIFSSVTGSAGRVLRAFGFSRPPRLDIDIPLLTRVHDPPMHSDGPSGAVVLGASQSQSLGISPLLGGGDGQEMSFEWICKIPGLVAQYSISPTSPSGAAVVHGFAVHPARIFTDGGGILQPSPLAGVALPFEFWTGDILVHFEIVASVFHRATLLVAWDCNCAAGASTPTMEVAQQTLPNTVITVSGNTAVTMRVPWNQQTPWLYVRGPANAATRNARSANGFLHVYVVNPVTSNGSTSPLPLNIYFSSDNIRFAAPEPGYIPLVSVTDAARPSESTGVIEPLSGPVLVVDDVQVAFGPRSDLSFVGLRAFGETPMSVKALAQKMVPYVSTVVTGLTSEENNFVSMRIPNNLPSAAALPIISGNAPSSGVPGLTSAVSRATWLGYFATAYVGVRGSLRRGFTLDYRTGSADAGAIHWASYDPWTTNPSGPLIVGTSFPPSGVGASLNRYSSVASNRQIAPMLEVVVPSMIANDFYCCGDAQSSEVSGRVEHIFQVPGAGTAAVNNVTWTTWVGAGDDLSFIRFVGFPAIESYTKPGPIGA